MGGALDELCDMSGYEVGKMMGLPASTVHTIEYRALAKVRVAFELVSLLGIDAAEAVLAQLTGKQLRHYRKALRNARVRKWS